MRFSIFFGQHDRHHTARFLGISRVLRMPAQITIVTIYFRKERLTVMLDAHEIMLAPRVDLVIKRIEGLNLHNDCVSRGGLKRRHSGRHHDTAAPE